jgi:hypothetical protein
LLAKNATKPVTSTTVNTARGQWFRVVSLVLSALEISDGPAEAIEAIRGPVLRASERAERRYPNGKGEEAAGPRDGVQTEGGGQAVVT